VSGPEPIEQLVKQERWRQQALDKIAGVKPDPPPENETSAQAFTRRQREQDDAERRDEELRTRVTNENPNVPVADPLREQAERSFARHRRRRKHGRVRWFRP
jgi:hypothetical protein